jgi:hypothetical protein
MSYLQCCSYYFSYLQCCSCHVSYWQFCSRNVNYLQCCSCYVSYLRCCSCYFSYLQCCSCHVSYLRCCSCYFSYLRCCSCYVSYYSFVRVTWVIDNAVRVTWIIYSVVRVTSVIYSVVRVTWVIYFIRMHGINYVIVGWLLFMTLTTWNAVMLETLTVAHLVKISLVFRRVRKTAKRDYWLRHVYPSIHMEQLGSYWTNFNEIWYFYIYRKSVEKSEVPLISGKINGYSPCRLM